MVSTCGICGGIVRSDVPGNWHPFKRARKAERDMQAHLKTHSFAELLRYEIRQDLEQVPEEQRPTIVRDIYRGLLGTTVNGQFTLESHDSQGTYSIDDVLGSIDMYRVWRTSNSCGDPSCKQHTAS
jgi:hypothetical protein